MPAGIFNGINGAYMNISVSHKQEDGSFTLLKLPIKVWEDGEVTPQGKWSIDQISSIVRALTHLMMVVEEVNMVQRTKEASTSGKFLGNEDNPSADDNLHGSDCDE